MATHKQKTAAIKTLENLGNKKPKPMGVILVESGYKPSVADTPQIVTESKGYQEILDELLPEDMVAQRHQELLNAAVISSHEFKAERIQSEIKKPDDDEDEDVMQKVSYSYKHVEDKTIKKVIQSVAGCKILYINEYAAHKTAYYQQPDNRSRKDAIDMAYKLRGNYAPEKHLNLNVNKNGDENPKVTSVITKFRKELKAAILNNNEEATKPSGNGN